MRSFMVRIATILITAILGMGAAAGAASAEEPLPINEMPESTYPSLCDQLERQGSNGVGLQNRNGVYRVYEFAGWHSDPQGYIDMRVNVYEDTGLNPIGWNKGARLGFTFISCP